ncbi:hypothetical protein QL285_038710 [Trifolium repens]|nr:hypothetical protein QL285_038710 [Trifolium repens]
MARKVIDRKIATLASLMRVGSWLTFLWNFRDEAKAFSLEQQKNAFLQESRDKNSSKSRKQLNLLRLGPFLCRGLPRNENGRHRRMLDIGCPGLYPGVLLWPICHPTYSKI